MNKYSGAIVAVVLMVWFGGNAHAAGPFYVNATGGNDASAGTSWATAWKTITKADSAKVVLAGGASTIYTDGTFYETLTAPKDTLIYVGNAGTTGKTIIDGRVGTTPTRNNCIATNGKDYITIDGYELTGSLQSAVLSGSWSDYTTIKNCYIHHAVQNGIMLSGGSRDNMYAVIQNNEISFCGLAATSGGIGGLGNAILLTGAADGATRVENALIEHNNIHDCGFDDHDHGIYDQGYQTIFKYNRVDGNSGFGVKIQNAQSGGADGGGCVAYNNLISNNRTGGVLIECSHITGDATHTKSVPVNNKANNNTLYRNGQDAASSYYSGLQYTYYEGTPAGNEFKNNIVYAPVVAANKVYFFSAGTAANSLTGLTFDNNLYYSPNAQLWRVGQGGGENSTTLAQWQGRTYTGTNDDNSITGWPKFNDQADSTTVSTDFRLQATSKAIDAGARVGLTSDYAHGPIPLGSAPDIGAYEFKVAFYVNAVNGVDTGRGTSWLNAWKTVDKADSAFAVKYSGASAIYTDGTFRERIDVPKDSLTYIGNAGPTGVTVITGADSVASNAWTSAGGSIYKTQFALKADSTQGVWDNEVALAHNHTNFATLTSGQYDWCEADSSLYVNVGANPATHTIKYAKRNYAV